jgi:predicted ATPase
VGRRHDLELLQSRLASATRGHGQVVGIAGEDGIGKSRLAHEFGARVSGEEAFFLWGHCTGEGHTTPFLPFVEVVRTSFAFLLLATTAGALAAAAAAGPLSELLLARRDAGLMLIAVFGLWVSQTTSC